MTSFLLNNFFLIVVMSIPLVYFYGGIRSLFELTDYKRVNKSTDYHSLLSSPFTPGISVIVPAHNEEKKIITHIKALFSIHYSTCEIIVVNDGSNDSTLERIIQEFSMDKDDYALYDYIPTQAIKGIYRSSNPIYNRLTVVDKEAGGKADALNSGINISQHPYFIGIDVNSVVNQDVLLKLIKPFLDYSHKKVIATGGVIRVSNSCKIVNGQVLQVNVPDNYWAGFQIIEFFRAFMRGRIAWSRVNGLLLTPVTLGMFNKELVIECGGYDPHVMDENMELIVRLRRYLYNKGMKHRVKYIPDSLGWMEVPVTLKSIRRQRSRWTQGCIDTLRAHHPLFFNPKYGSLGMIRYPFWFFFEWMAPLVETIACFFIFYMIVAGIMDWSIFLVFFLSIYLFSVSFSFYAILFNEYSSTDDKRFAHLHKLFLLSFIEPIIYHPLSVYWAIRGNLSYLFHLNG